MKVVFLHGIGDGDPQRKWLSALNSGLSQLGQPRLDESDVVAPRYASYLKTDGVSAKLPRGTYRPRNEAAARQDFERRQARVQRMLQLNPAVQWFGFGVVPDFLWDHVPPAVIAASRLADAFNLSQVRRYVRTEGLRGAIMTRILEELPLSGEIILVGHSLGSVIAIDLLDHLPETLHVRRFITIGSPASIKALHDGSERLLKKFPYCRVDDWSNFLNRFDPVTGGRGLAGVFPGAQDFVLQDVSGHGADQYMADRAIAELIADVIYPRKDLVPSFSDIEVRLNDGEAWELLVLHFREAVAHRIKDDDTRQRYRSASKVLREDLISQIQQLGRDGRPLAAELRQLAGGSLPTLCRRWEVHDVVPLLVVLGLVNWVEPYEIDTTEANQAALVDIAADLGFREGVGAKVREAIDEVKKAVSSNGIPWGRVLAAAAGLALIAAGPVGLMAVAPASAFGAAALTGSLAAFGPGGMAGGIAMIGGLTGAGAALTTAATTAESGAGTGLPVLVQMMMAVTVEYARKLLDLPHDTALWYALANFESQVSASINRLETFSDKKSPKLEQLRETKTAIGTLFRFMLSRGLSPKEITDGESRR